jgi:hypothetical protein
VVSLIWHRDRRLPAAAQELIAIVREVAALHDLKSRAA